MKVLIIGGGGREHALVWRLLQSPRVKELHCAPGNGGISAERADGKTVRCHPWDGKDLDALISLAQIQKIDFTVVGPEAPLAAGVVDLFTARGLRIFGPTKAAAQLESSKAFAKHFLQRNNIPTAHYAVCTSTDDLKDSLKHFHGKIVVKADGLAAGKGVVIANDREEAAAVATEMLAGNLVGAAGASVVLEEFLEGDELSFLVLCDGERVAPLVAAQDHKRVGDGDTGPNTGGMGAYSARELLDAQMREWLIHHIAQPVVTAMAADGVAYKGILYCGLMMTARGPQVLEFNCRFGDPETQAILLRLDSDLLAAFESAVDGRVSDGIFQWSDDASVCVVLASGGYPGPYEILKPIAGLREASALKDVKVFHAGTVTRDGGIVTNGGRVLNVCARAATLKEALEKAYDAAARISFDGMHYRKDIGARALAKT